MDILTDTENELSYLLKHLCGGTRLYFRVCLLCILLPMGSGAGHWVSIPCLSWEIHHSKHDNIEPQKHKIHKLTHNYRQTFNHTCSNT